MTSTNLKNLEENLNPKEILLINFNNKNNYNIIWFWVFFYESVDLAYNVVKLSIMVLQVFIIMVSSRRKEKEKQHEETAELLKEIKI